MRDVVAEARATLTPDELEDFEERAAIMEYAGGLSRQEAEEKALARVLSKRVPS